MQLYQNKRLVVPYCYKIGKSDHGVHSVLQSGGGTVSFYRYFMLRIKSVSDQILQYSYLKFIDNDTNYSIFKYPEDMTGIYRWSDFDDSGCAPTETPVAGTSDNKNNKFCRIFRNYGDGRIMYDLGYPALNVKKFNRWMVWTSNDSHIEGRYMQRFAMYVSNVGDIDADLDAENSSWVTFDKNYWNDDLPEGAPEVPFEWPGSWGESRFTLAYMSNKFILEDTLWK